MQHRLFYALCLDFPTLPGCRLLQNNPEGHNDAYPAAARQSSTLYIFIKRLYSSATVLVI